MIINHNMASLNTYRQLSANNANSAKSLEKLSSGLRINRAGDDAAGLAISEKMRGQIRGLDQAARNAQDGISMIQTAEGNLNETHSILQRMKELATQAANDTNVSADRSEIQKEINQLTSEINRIGNTTEFNTQKLLDGGGAKNVDLSVNTTQAGGVKGNISSVTTITTSETGKSIVQMGLSGGKMLTIEGANVGTDLNGITFTFADGSTPGVTNDGAGHITVTADFAGGKNAQDIQTLINGSGLVTSPISVKITDGTGAIDTGSFTTADVAGKTTAAMAKGRDSEVRGSYSFDISSAFSKAGDTFTLKVPTSGTPLSTETITLTAANTGAVAGSGQFNIMNGSSFMTAAEQADSIKAALTSSGGSAYIGDRYDVTVTGSKIVLTEKSGQTQGMAVEKGTVSATAQAGSYTYNHTSSKLIEAGGKFTVDGVDIRVVDGTGENDSADIMAGRAILNDGNDTAADQATKLAEAIGTRNAELNYKYSVVDDTSGGLTFTQKSNQESASAITLKSTDKAGNGFEAKFQIGANTAQSMTIQINDMRAQALKVSGATAGGSITASNGSVATLKATKEVTDGTNNTSVEYALDVSSHDKATAAISVLDDAIQNVSAERSKLGAYQNRLEHTINNLGTSSENLTAAESRIRDVDMAKEMMNFQKNNILSQAAQAMLAQANQQPQGVLQLLR